MSSGGGSTTTTQNSVSTKELPAWLEDAAQKNIARGQMVADVGYVPYYGLDTAGFSPMQTSGFQNTANAAAAFGLGAPTDVNAYMPKTTTNNLGFTGYSSGNAFDSALAQLAANRPAQYTAIESQFTDPITGSASIPTALSVLANPNSTDAQIESLYGNLPETLKSQFEQYDTRTPYEKYLYTKSFMNDDSPVNAAIKAGFLGAIAQPLNENFIKNFEDKYTTSVVDGVKTTSDPVIASRYGYDYVPTQSTNLLVSHNAGGAPSESNSYWSDSGHNWSDYGGYTGVSGTGVNAGNDFAAFSNSGWDGSSGSWW